MIEEAKSIKVRVPILRQKKNMKSDDKQYSHQLDSLISLYAEACEWLGELGIAYSKNRYGLYKQHFDKFTALANGSIAPKIEDLLGFKKKFDNAYLEINQLVRIYDNLKGVDSGEFIEQVRKVASGQEFRANSENDQARDFLFELSIASRFIKAGYSTSLTGICDVVVDLLDEGTLFVECKRIRSQSKIGVNIKKASKQISSRMEHKVSSKIFGLIAINVTDLLPDSNMLTPSSMQSGIAMHRAISQNFIRTNLDEIGSGSRGKSLGVMCVSEMMTHLMLDSNVPGLFYSRHTGFIPYTKSKLLETLAPKISNQDII